MEQYHNRLKRIMDEYVHLIYKVTKNFPKDELYGVTSQLRRATLSIILNYIEGYARISLGSYYNFLKISYGSLKESKYLIHFSLKEGYLDQDNYNEAIKLADEIGAMLWSIIKEQQ